MAQAAARYTVPALERGLDVIELLARQETRMTLAEIAAALGLTSSAVFRSLVVLEERGYIARQPPGDAYGLTLRLFELAHIRPPLHRLLDIAVPAMRHFARGFGQACHLSVYDAGSLLIVADVEGPGSLNLAFRLGSRWPLCTTASGRALLSQQDAPTQAAWLRQAPEEPPDELPAVLADIARTGTARAVNETMGGVIDLAVAIPGRYGAIAALAVSAVRRLAGQSFDEGLVVAELRRTAEQIGAALGNPVKDNDNGGIA